MDKLGRGYDVNEIHGVRVIPNSDTILTIKLPESRTLRIMSRSLFLVMLLLALPTLLSLMRSFSGSFLYEPDLNPNASNGFMILPILLRDLVEEGLIKKGNKGYILGATAGEIGNGYEFLKDAGVDLLTGADLQHKNVVEHQVFDFLFATSFQGIQGADNILKDSGLIISPLGHDPSDRPRSLSGYKIVYLRRFESTVVAMRRTGPSSSNSQEVLCGVVSSEEKRAALKGLEDVYFEPPRRVDLEKKSSFMSRKIKFLPDLLKDPLDEYPRRVFISDDSSAIDWFYNNYPMRHQEFDVLNMEVGSSKGVSDWMRKKVRRQDYVVMKAEARVVEQMLKDSTLSLVDELFLECENQWQDGEEETGSKRPYWECLALYGKVRDEGIAVHQWWT